MGRGFDRQDNGRASRHHSHHGRFVAERHFLRRARVADALCAAFLSGLLPARTERALAARDRPRRPAAHGRALLGSGRARNAEASLAHPTSVTSAFASAIIRPTCGSSARASAPIPWEGAVFVLSTSSIV